MGDVTGLRELAARQNGLFRADQARAHGLSRDWVSHRTGDRLSCVLPGIYWQRTGPLPRDVQLDAALLYAGDDAVLSHWTAAEIWGLRDVRRPEVHVTTPLARPVAGVRRKVVTHRSTHLSDSATRLRDGRPVTTIERTVVDIAEPLSVRGLRAVTADVVQRGLTTPARLVAELSERPTLPAVKSLASVLLAVSAGARSVLEIELRELIERAGFAMPAHGVPILGGSGRSYYVDNVWRDRGLIAEVDGREWHLSPDDWERDLDRTADLVDAGNLVLRFTTNAIRRRPAQTLARIKRQLESAR